MFYSQGLKIKVNIIDIILIIKEYIEGKRNEKV